MKTIINFLLALSPLFLVGGHVDAQALDEQSALKHHRISCASTEEVRLVVPETMVRADVQLEGVLCAFRNKIGGFPTINVIREPRQTSSRSLSLAERSTELIRSYGLVGLTDATVEEAHETTIHGTPAYWATVRYSNKNTPMTTLVLIIELPDRSYTVSALDTTEGFKTTENSLREALKTVTVEGATVVSDTKSTKTSGLGTVLAGIALALALLALRRYLKRRTDSR